MVLIRQGVCCSTYQKCQKGNYPTQFQIITPSSSCLLNVCKIKYRDYGVLTLTTYMYGGDFDVRDLIPGK